METWRRMLGNPPAQRIMYPKVKPGDLGAHTMNEFQKVLDGMPTLKRLTPGSDLRAARIKGGGRLGLLAGLLTSLGLDPNARHMAGAEASKDINWWKNYVSSLVATKK